MISTSSLCKVLKIDGKTEYQTQQSCAEQVHSAFALKHARHKSDGQVTSNGCQTTACQNDFCMENFSIR